MFISNFVFLDHSLIISNLASLSSSGQKNRALHVPLIVPCKALGDFPGLCMGQWGGTCRA